MSIEGSLYPNTPPTCNELTGMDDRITSIESGLDALKDVSSNNSAELDGAYAENLLLSLINYNAKWKPVALR
ncbi:hypothetical protein TKK_0013768 [Trichogramma kaykai]